MFHIFLHLVTSASVNRTFDNSAVLMKLQWTCSSAIILRLSKGCHLGLSFTPAKHLYCSTSCSLLRTNCSEIKITKNCLKKPLKEKRKNSFTRNTEFVTQITHKFTFLFVMFLRIAGELHVPIPLCAVPHPPSSALVTALKRKMVQHLATSWILNWSQTYLNMLFALTTITSRIQIPLGTVAVPKL